MAQAVCQEWRKKMKYEMKFKGKKRTTKTSAFNSNFGKRNNGTECMNGIVRKKATTTKKMKKRKK